MPLIYFCNIWLITFKLYKVLSFIKVKIFLLDKNGINNLLKKKLEIKILLSMVFIFGNFWLINSEIILQIFFIGVGIKRISFNISVKICSIKSIAI